MPDFNIEEFEQHYGEEFGRTVFYLHSYWCRVFITFVKYSNLFGKSKERVELLNSVSPNLFHHIQDIFFNEVILGICRLTDPERTGRSKNLTIQLLARFIEEKDFYNQINEAVKEAVEASSFARDRRNKIISHSDFNIVTGPSIAVPSGSIVEIRRSLKAIHKPIRLIRLKHEDVDTRPIVIGTRDEFSLMRLLFEAKSNEENFEENLKERLRNQDYSDPYPSWLFDPDEEDDWK